MTDPDFARRLQLEAVDSFDEELELELEDRPYDADGNEIPLTDAERRDRHVYFGELLRLQGGRPARAQ